MLMITATAITIFPTAGLLEQQGFSKTKQLQDIRVYKDVQIRFPICTGNGLAYQIQFNNSRFRGIRWENSKRLIYGSLLCLSKDNFENFVLATVENREVKKLKEVSGNTFRYSFRAKEAIEVRLHINKHQ